MKQADKNGIKTGYELLTEMIQVKTFKSSMRPNIFPLTNRAMFIINTLNSMGCKYEVDIFSDEGKDIESYSKPKLVNIVVKFDSPSNLPAIVFCAHHDIVNPDSQNCQDNSASVCNLLHLCGVLKSKAVGEGKNILEQRPVIIVFTDKEECGGVGASRMSDRLNNGDYGNFEYVVNLELTGLGGEIWADIDNIFPSWSNTWSNNDSDDFLMGSDDVLFPKRGFGSSFSFEGGFMGMGRSFTSVLGKKDNKKTFETTTTLKREKEKKKEDTKLIKRIEEVLGKDGYHKVHTPFSDACIFRDNGIDSVCVGILPKKEVTSTHKETWGLCHRDDDTIDKCNANDMNEFVKVLEKLI